MRKSQQPRFSLSEHLEFSASLRAATTAINKVPLSFPATSRETTAALKAVAAIERLRSRMDDEVARLLPRRKDPTDQFKHVYYGAVPFDEAKVQVDPE